MNRVTTATLASSATNTSAGRQVLSADLVDVLIAIESLTDLTAVLMAHVRRRRSQLRALEAETGISRTTWSAWARGRRVMSRDRLRQVANSYDPGHLELWLATWDRLAAHQAGATGRQTGSRADRRPGAWTIPAQLPGDLASFVGRGRELGILDGLLTPLEESATGPRAVAVVSGMPGVGKTALVIHWAHRVSDRFPDGQLHINLRGFDPQHPPLPPADALRSLLSALGVAERRIHHESFEF